MTIPRIQNGKLISACLAPGWFSCITLSEEKNCEERGQSCQSVRPQCLPPQLTPASYCKLQACIPLWVLMVPVSCSCCAPNWPHSSPSPLPHCVWSFPMSNSFPSMSNPKMSPPWTGSFSLFLILWAQNCEYNLFGIYHMNHFHCYISSLPAILSKTSELISTLLSATPHYHHQWHLRCSASEVLTKHRPSKDNWPSHPVHPNNCAFMVAMATVARVVSVANLSTILFHGTLQLVPMLKFLYQFND